MKAPAILLAFASISPFLPSDDDGIDRVGIFLNGEFVTNTVFLHGEHLTLDLQAGDTLGLVAGTDWGGIWEATVDVHRCPETWVQRLTRVSDWHYEAIFSMPIDTALVGGELELVLNYDPGTGMPPWHFATIAPSGGERR